MARIVPQNGCLGGSRFAISGWLGLLVLFSSLEWAQPVWAVEPTFSYYDQVPPIDQTELDAVRERTREARKRLERPRPEGSQPAEAKQPLPLPPPIGDERDGVPPIDFQEVDELRRQFEELSPKRRAAETQTPKSEESPVPKQPPPPAPPPALKQKEAGPKETGKEGDVDQQVKALNERVAALERVLVGTDEHPGLAGLIGGYTRNNGFFLMSDNGDFFLRLPVLLQVDLRTFPGGQNGTNPGVTPSTFILQRARPMVHFRLWRYFRGFMTPDFGNGFTQSPLVQGRVQTPDAFAEWDYFSTFRLRMGKFKSIVGLEMLQAPQNLSFMERSLTRNLLPNRDLGAMAWGVFNHGQLEYQVGVFNGSPNANFYQESEASNSAKTFEARLFSRPFVTHTTSWLRGFGTGVGMSLGSVKQANPQDPMQTETFSYTFFQYFPQVTGNGNRLRVSPQFGWYWWRFGVQGQYVRSTQKLMRTDTGQLATTTHDSWSGQVSFLLTDDTATFGHIVPKRPVNPSKNQWGAWEIAARYAQLNIDPLTFASNMADPGVSILRAKSATVGLNWYLNANVRLTANFVHTDFTGAARAYHAASHEDGLMFRTQLTF